MSNVGSLEQKAASRSGKRPWRLAAVGLALGVVLGLALLWVVRTRPFAPPEFNGMVIQSPQPAANFTLTGPGGDPVNLHDFRGKVVLLYYGYTYCPDVCPATSVELRRAVEALGKDADDVQVIMVSVDPERDTPEQLQAYVTSFHPDFIGLTGDESELLAATTPFGIFYEKHEGTAATGYLVDHTASVTVLDQEGYLRLVYPFGVSGLEIAEDLQHLVR